ncbi:hypothetical protein [Micromonospora auratinigra]|uniref:Excreted virulence factor EspC, type VII ESX diderm n=1 Tax=Micromonospora auratinigra TaxID=261654 RepID=A0A1A8ZQJ7_9ACTN|nr:hypothetical protein [Micromonospora auratinigra]SBT46107.1 hypothetical protein GA0070611_3262 [Micromonospora auratinigra]
MGSSAKPNVGDLSVNVEHLDAAVTYIDRLLQYLDSEVTLHMEHVNARMQSPSDTNTKSAVPGATPFGAFEDARLQWAALGKSTGNMQASLTVLKQKLEALKTGTQDIAKAFRDTEERNGANGKQIERLLESAAPPPGSAVTPPAVSTPPAYAVPDNA